MSIKCPECLSDLNLNTNSCKNGHSFEQKHGCLILHETSFKSWFDPFESSFQAYRKRNNSKIVDPTIYDQLPFVDNDLSDGNWKEKIKDLALIRQLIPSAKSQKVLEIGAWNHWLTNRLNKDGHQLTAIDYFIDQFDGLGAKTHYKSNEWLSIQLNLERLDIIDETFDIIIVNRAIIYFKDPLSVLKALKEKLKPNGQIIITGLIYDRYPGKFMTRFNALNEEFEIKEGFSLAIKPFYGAFGNKELQDAQELGYTSHEYKLSFLQYLSRQIKRRDEKLMYLVYKA